MELYKSSEITVHKLNELRDEDKNIQILDVREDTERDHAHVKGTIHIKLNEIANRYQKNLKGSQWKCLNQINGYTGYYKQIIISPIKRKYLENYLRKNNIILTGGVYNLPLHKQSRYKNKNKANT